MKVVIVAGPTATGKSKTALEIAKNLNGELINADSRQVYKYLDIGTNKDDLTYIDGVYYIDKIPMHLVNILNPDERFSLYRFQKDAIEKIKEISSRGKLPILVGGTGLYLDSIIKGYAFSESTNSKYSREYLEEQNLEALQKLALEENPEMFNSLNESDNKNSRRLIRVIEKSNSEQEVKIDVNIEPLVLYPNYDWEVLKELIDTRVQEMFNKGLMDEVINLLSMGFDRDCDGLRTMGYRHILDYIDDRIDLPTCKENIKTAHKQYARKQRTWFEGERRDYKLNRFSDTAEAVKIVKNFIQ